MDDQNKQQTADQVQQDTTQLDETKFLPIPPEVRMYLEAILEEADLLIATDEEQEQVVQNMYKQFDLFLLNVIAENIPEDKEDAFVDLSEKGASPQEIQNFITAIIPNTKDVFDKAFEDFRELFLNSVAAEEARMEAVLSEDATITDPTAVLEKLKYQDITQIKS